MYKFYYYPKCSTCIRAKKQLDLKNIEYELINLSEVSVEKEVLKKIISKFSFDIHKLFNVSGKLYRELNMKDKIKSMCKQDMIDILANNGMLVKRPILISEDFLCVGFKQENYDAL